jgi:hypothetical protein
VTAIVLPVDFRRAVEIRSVRIDLERFVSVNVPPPLSHFPPSVPALHRRYRAGDPLGRGQGFAAIRDALAEPLYDPNDPAVKPPPDFLDAVPPKS